MIAAVRAAAQPSDCKTMELISLTESCCLGEPTKAKLLLDDEQVDDDMLVTAVRQVSRPRSPLTLQHSSKSHGRGYCALSLLISDGTPREEKMISFWHVSLEQKWCVTEADEIIHQGYFSGNPPCDYRVVLAAQLPPKNGNKAVTSLWMGSFKDGFEWQKGKVKCSYDDRGIHSIVLFQDMILWLTDNGSLCSVKKSSLCSVKKSSKGIHITAQKGACDSNTMNFSLVQHGNKLYIVKSGGFLPYEAPGIYEVIPGSQTAIQETTLVGKDIFVVHNMGGFILQSNLDDCRIFTGSMCQMLNVQCSAPKGIVMRK